MNLKGLTKKQKQKAIDSSVGWMEIKIRRKPELGWTEMFFVTRFYFTKKEMKIFKTKRCYCKDMFWFKGKRGSKDVPGYIENGRLELGIRGSYSREHKFTKFQTREATFVDKSNPGEIVFRSWEFDERKQDIVEVTAKSF